MTCNDTRAHEHAGVTLSGVEGRAGSTPLTMTFTLENFLPKKACLNPCCSA